MSSSSIDRQQSPTIEEEAVDNDGGRAPPPEADTQRRHLTPDSEEDHRCSTNSSILKAAPPMNLPIDQDLFDSRPTSPPQTPAKSDAQDPPCPPTSTSDKNDEEHLLPPPDFRPFFTLILEPTTGEHHHPTVHYLFSDDDDSEPETLTSAALYAIDTHDENDDETEQRVVILDISPDGKSILNAVSLSPQWQGVQTEIMAAPSMGEAETGGDEGGKGLMLKISGAEGRRDERVGGDLDALVARFGEVVGELDRVVGKRVDVGTQEVGEDEGRSKVE